MQGGGFGEVGKALTELSTLWPRGTHMTIDVRRNLWFERSSERRTQSLYLDARRTFRIPLAQPEIWGREFLRAIVSIPSDHDDRGGYGGESEP